MSCDEKIFIRRRPGRFVAFFLSVIILSFAAVPLNSVYAASEPLMLIPGGMPFGVKLDTRGVVVAGINGGSFTRNAARKAGLRAGDVITGIDGKELNSSAELIQAIENSKGNTVALTVIRDKSIIKLTLTPEKSDADGKYRAGIRVRDNAAGLGTVTYILPETGYFGGLGHGIQDPDTAVLLPVLRGTVFGVTISGVKRGQPGTAGELKGYFLPEKTGALFCNTDFGIFGILTEIPSDYPPLPVADTDDIKNGNAVIRCTVDGNGIGEYSVDISGLKLHDRDTRNFVITVTDDRLISLTGGIVQGMSGSPVIQNGMIIGAVTHVTVGNPTSGYGIFIGNMLDNMPS